MVQENSISKQIIVICGPTGSGKTKLAVNLAKRLDTEIISADSVAIYKKLNIGSAKPSISEMQGVKHHLIDIVEPYEEFSVSDYEHYALDIVDNLFSRNKIPIVCGGTGFYVNSILYKKSYGNAPANPEIREKYLNILREKGVDYLYSILEEVDMESAKTIHKNNTVRVIRALEIYEVSGQKKSSIIDDTVPRYKFSAFMYDYNRKELYDKINSRVDVMISCGLIDEVKSLISEGITDKNQCMQGIGYKEVYDAINNGTLDTVSEQIKINTRHYAKRQLTFFNKLQGLKLIDPKLNDDVVVDAIIKGLYE